VARPWLGEWSTPPSCDDADERGAAEWRRSSLSRPSGYFLAADFLAADFLAADFLVAGFFAADFFSAAG